MSKLKSFLLIFKALLITGVLVVVSSYLVKEYVSDDFLKGGLSALGGYLITSCSIFYVLNKLNKETLKNENSR